MATVYVAGRTSEIDRVRAVQRTVEDVGHSITYDWTRAEARKPRVGWRGNPDEARFLAQAELDAASRCQICVLVDPQPGRREPGGLGCYIEAGAALASGADLFVLKPRRTSVFYFLDATRMFGDAGELRAALEEW